MLGTLRLPRPLLGLLAAGPVAASLLVTSLPATAAPSVPSAVSAAWSVHWASQTRAAPSPTSGGVYGSYDPVLSGDGTRVVFASTGRLTGDGSAFPDAGQRAFTSRVHAPRPARLATAPSGQVGNGVDDSTCTGCGGEMGVSGDGRTAVFVSRADNLTPGDTNGTADVFLRDLTTGSVTLVSHGPGGAPADDLSQSPQLSTDGRWVLYGSQATNLVPGSHQPGRYLYDTLTDSSQRLDSLDGMYGVILAGNGARALVQTFSALVPADQDTRSDSYVVDLATGAATLVSVSTAGTHLHGTGSSISDDGTKVTLLYGYGGTKPVKVAVRDLTTGRTTPVPVATYNSDATISGDGTRVVIVGGGVADSAVEVRDLASGQVLYRSGSARPGA